jgi:hypothetical protein
VKEADAPGSASKRSRRHRPKSPTADPVVESQSPVVANSGVDESGILGADTVKITFGAPSSADAPELNILLEQYVICLSKCNVF